MNKGTLGGWAKSSPSEYLLREENVGGGSSIITFDNIPQRFQDLRFTFALRSNVAAVSDTIQLHVNGDLGASYSTQDLNAQGAVATAAESLNTSSPVLLVIAGDTAPAGSYAMGEIKIPYYSSPTAGMKHAMAQWATRNNTTTGETELYIRAAVYHPTATVPRQSWNRIELSLVTGTQFMPGSIITMYGSGRISPSLTAGP